MNTIGGWNEIYYLIVNIYDAGRTFRRQPGRSDSVMGVDITEVVTFYPKVDSLSLMARRAYAVCKIVAHFFLIALTLTWPQTRAYHMQQISLAKQSLSSFSGYQRRAQEGIQRLRDIITNVSGGGGSSEEESWKKANVAILYSEEGREIARVDSKAYYEKISVEKQLSSGQLLHWIKGGEEVSPEGMSEQHQLYSISAICSRCESAVARDLYLRASLPQIALGWEDPTGNWNEEQHSQIKDLTNHPTDRRYQILQTINDSLGTIASHRKRLVEAITYVYRNSSGVFDPSLLFGRPNPSANIHKESFIFTG